VGRNRLLLRPCRGRSKKGYPQARLYVRGNNVEVRDAREVADVINANLTAGVLQRIGESARRVLVEGADQLKTGTVEYFADPGADDGFISLAEKFLSPAARGAQRVGDGDAGSK